MSEASTAQSYVGGGTHLDTPTATATVSELNTLYMNTFTYIRTS